MSEHEHWYRDEITRLKREIELLQDAGIKLVASHSAKNAEIERLKADRQKLLTFVRNLETQIGDGYLWQAREVLRDIGEI